MAAEEYCDGKARIVIREDFCLRRPEDIEELLQRIKPVSYTHLDVYKRQVLTVAMLAILITAPMGAFLIDLTYRRLLSCETAEGG